MRVLVVAILAISAVAAAGTAQAQTFDPNYPVCLHVFGPDTFYDCGFTSLPQCAATASGRSAQCVVNPYFAGADEESIGRPHRRHRHHA